MLPFIESLVRQVNLTTVLDIAITAVFIYWLFSLIRGTRAVTLIIGVSVLLDAMLVRLVLLPALMRMLGRRAWALPHRVDRILPRVRFDHA